MNQKSKITSDYLFHFTRERRHLVNIMDNYFMPFYCMERLNYIDLYDDGTFDEHAYPLVSFCDIPGELQEKHKFDYGYYGLGLSKSWGVKNNLSPVVYTHKDSIISANLRHLFQFLSRKWDEKTDEVLSFSNDISFLKMQYKAYEGNKYLKETCEFEEDITRFYDEREWRYLPLNCNGLRLWLERSEFEDEEKRKAYNEKIQACNKLEFKISDIEYLILTDDSEIKPFLEEISSKYNEEDLIEIKGKIRIEPIPPKET